MRPSLPWPIWPTLALAACAGTQSALDPGGPSSASIDLLGIIMYVGATAVTLLVTVLMLAPFLRRRQRPVSRGLFLWGGGVALPALTVAAFVPYVMTRPRDVRLDRAGSAVRQHNGASLLVGHVIPASGMPPPCWVIAQLPIHTAERCYRDLRQLALAPHSSTIGGDNFLGDWFGVQGAIGQEALTTCGITAPNTDETGGISMTPSLRGPVWTKIPP